MVLALDPVDFVWMDWEDVAFFKVYNFPLNFKPSPTSNDFYNL